MLLMEVIKYRPMRDPGRFGWCKNDRRLDPMIPGIATP
jgi:hypothetical protein